jgi:Zn-dependent peptidase ImmA (M78 family)
MKVGINTDRIKYLLTYFNLSEKELLSVLNEDRKKPFLDKDVFSPEIELSLLKKIEVYFKCGMTFFYDFTPLSTAHNQSIFFRKKSFCSEPNQETRRIVFQFERLKTQLDAYASLSDNIINVYQKSYSLEDDPQIAANEVRRDFYPDRRIKNQREFLKEFINKCSEHGVYVFEFVENWNKKEKANVDGICVMPNMIILKHQQWYKREIFTLAHELGHFLLHEENLNTVDIDNKKIFSRSDSLVENWCNEFAFRFIVGDAIQKIDSEGYLDSSNDYGRAIIRTIADNTHISTIALYTHCLYANKVSLPDYENIYKEHLEKVDTEKKRKESVAVDEGEKKKNFARTAKPIISKLFMESMQYAFFKGVINEPTFCSQLKITPAEAEGKYLW